MPIKSSSAMPQQVQQTQANTTTTKTINDVDDDDITNSASLLLAAAENNDKASTNENATNTNQPFSTLRELSQAMNGGSSSSGGNISNGTTENNGNASSSHSISNNASSITNNVSRTNNATTKLNGLKNRIIQRPPPLILDKVSNFYDNETQFPINQHQQPNTSSKGANSNSETTATSTASIATSTTTTTVSNDNLIYNQQRGSQSNNNNGNSNAANHKFWASLNQNAASRSKSMIAGLFSNNLIDNVPSNSANLNNNDLGADLIITHRNNGTTVPGVSRISHSSASLMTSNQKNNHPQQQPNELTRKSPSSIKKIFNQLPTLSKQQENISPIAKPQDMSNNSEFDDISIHGGGANESDGGNLIGVENPTPPAYAGAPSENGLEIVESPTSATSTRPRSNNPFLEMDEESLSTFADSHNNFRKRPASFIAATGSALATRRQHDLDPISSQDNPKMVREQFNEMHVDVHHKQSQLMQHPKQTDNLYSSKREIIQVDNQTSHEDQRDSSSYSYMQQTHPTYAHQTQPSIYGVYESNYMNYQPTISIDSESAVCKPPPSATMQLPHWTEAIYQLRNALLETSSIAGGSENGEFIYIVESGDIILELDDIKVSGFTLAEFNELVESKTFHLLRATQTKHSHGLTTDLRHYLSCSFPKDSTDKELQDLIRENIYRRTIPCTTRPPKEGEVDKVDYHFMSKEQFIELNNRGMLLECGTFGGHYYGTMKSFSDFDISATQNSFDNGGEVSDKKHQHSDTKHPTIESSDQKCTVEASNNPNDNPFYENHESLARQQMQVSYKQTQPHLVSHNLAINLNQRPLPVIESTVPELSSIVAVDSEALPNGWERITDQTHGIVYIDHNTQTTQYERPYEIELTKGSMGFGFTLVEADNGVLLVRSVIPGGPAHLNGTIRPGDILISAVGVPVAGLQHTDIAKLFSTFAVGDRVRLTFARSTYIVDANLIPDEYLFSNGTNGDLTVAVNSNYHNYFNQNMVFQSPQALVNQEFEYIRVLMKKGENGFGFTISDYKYGQRVRTIQNNEICNNLKQGDILISLNEQDITKLTHKEVAERLKNYPVGHDITLVVKRKKRFRSKTPMAMHTENDEYSLDSTPQRNCKTPNLDGLMLKNIAYQDAISSEPVSRALFPQVSSGTNQTLSHSIDPKPLDSNNLIPNTDSCIEPAIPSNYYTLPVAPVDSQSLYEANPMLKNELYYNQQPQPTSLPTLTRMIGLDPHSDGARVPSVTASDNQKNLTSSVHPSVTSLPTMKFSNLNGLSQINQYNNFMNNDKLMMMQMQQQKSSQQMLQPSKITSDRNPDYHHMPLYSNSEMLKAENLSPVVPVPIKPVTRYLPETSYHNNIHNNYYANNEELALQNVQYGSNQSEAFPSISDQSSHSAIMSHQPTFRSQIPIDEQSKYEYLEIDLDRESTNSNWGIRLIGGSEVGRAISIGSIVSGGAASKNGKLKSGDEIISIDGQSVVGAAHQDVVKLISACSNRVSLVVRRKPFEDACEVVLTRNLDEGFGFVIITSGNCAVIGRIIEGSPADRCQQLHVKDRIIAVNGRFITPSVQHPEIVNMIKECGSTLRLLIIPVDCYTVEVIKSAPNDNFGFTMRGGSNFNGTPLYILRVAPDGLARDLLNVGDQIIEINGISTVGMTNSQAAEIIRRNDHTVKLKLRRNHSTPPCLLVDSPRALQKYNQVTAEMKAVNTNPNSFSNFQDRSVSSDGQQQQFTSYGQHNQQRGSNMDFNQSLTMFAT